MLLHDRVVSNGGEEHRARVYYTNCSNGSHVGTICGGFGWLVALCSVCSLWDNGRSVCFSSSRDIKPTPL